uniref:AN1-type domain-containing protein n=1 Tax=Oryza punctata TaxID=4537 RepID=A0A0E0LV80_ORYPU
MAQLELAACANCGGLFGTTARTKNLCARCYRDHLNAVDNATEAARTRALLASLAGSCLGAAAAAESSSSSAPPAKPNKCMACRKKVGLLGFECRCGGVFCSLHRYADKHGCSFDFRKSDRKKIAKENPLIIAAKITKF